MKLGLFLARRLYQDEERRKLTSRPAVIIAMVGIAIGLAIMIISVAVMVGFKSEINHKITGFGGHVQVSNLYSNGIYESRPIAIPDSLSKIWQTDAWVEHVQRYSLKAGILRNEEGFQGVLLKGVASDYDLSFLQSCLLEGEIPQFSDSIISHKILLSKILADKLKLKVGDKIDSYFFQNNIRVRRFLVSGIYQTHFGQFDNLYLITDLALINRLNQWSANQISGLEFTLKEFHKNRDFAFYWADELVGKKDAYGQRFCVQSIEQLYPQIFAWLDILDVNVWVILVLMLGVAGFTMISGLLILIIERTPMIGLLKSLGADNQSVRQVFIWLGVMLIGRGMLWGNVIALSLYAIQKYMQVFKLDASIYYMDVVPVNLLGWHWLLINLGTLIISILMLLAPSYLVSRVHPASTMRYE